MGFYLSTVAESEQVSPSLNHQCQMASFLVVQDVKSIKIELSLPPVKWSSCYLLTIDFTQRICDTVSMMPLTVNVFKMIVKCIALVWTLNRIYFMTFYKPLIPCFSLLFCSLLLLNPADGHLPLQHEWFGANTLQTFLCIPSADMLLTLTFLSTVVIQVICYGWPMRTPLHHGLQYVKVV